MSAEKCHQLSRPYITVADVSLPMTEQIMSVRFVLCSSATDI